MCDGKQWVTSPRSKEVFSSETCEAGTSETDTCENADKKERGQEKN